MALHEDVAIVGVIDPQTVNNTSVTSTWVDMQMFDEVMFVVSVGTTDVTVDAKLREATSDTGTGAQDLSGKAITQLSGTDDDKQVVIRVKSDELSSGYRYVACVVTAGNATGADVSCVALGSGCRYGPATDYDLASVAEIVA